MMADIIKKYRVFIVVVLINLLLFLNWPEAAQLSTKNSLDFLWEVVKILPPIMILMGLLEMWVSRASIEAHLGAESGARGAILSMLLGSVAAGPLFAAFPIAISLKNKGVRTSNIIIFLGSWATIKVPMLIIESSFIGLRFALTRLVITIPFILGIGYFMESYLKKVGEDAQI